MERAKSQELRAALHFAVLHHTAWPNHPDHFDLMLQTAIGQNDNSAVLKTFATVDDQFPHAGATIFQPISNHRRLYLSYEGVLSSQRGCVKRADEGLVKWLVNPGGAELEFELLGRKLNGKFTMKKLPDERYRFESG